MSKVIGIDLGTTNSVVTYLDGGKAIPIEVDGAPTMPSVVLFHDGKVVVGREARNLHHRHPTDTIVSVKRHMGTDTVFEVGGRSVSPEHVSGEILRTLKRAAEVTLGAKIHQAVITVPAYFDDAQRRATLNAGEFAGLEVLRLVNEPTSASLIYEQVEHIDDGSTDGTEYVMIYDLGGGTFDVSILEVFEGVREVRATAGNTRLGGDDFDQLLLDRFVDSLRHEHDVDVAEDPGTMARLRRLAESTKIALSSVLTFEVSEEFLAIRDGKPIHFRHVVTRQEFEEAIATHIDSTITLTRKALDDAGIDTHSLARICLVGGSTRIPLVRDRLREAIGVQLHEDIDPDLAVGLGAAVQGGIIAGEPVERILVDVTAHSLGLLTIDGLNPDEEAMQDRFSVVIPRNTVLPAEGRRECYTSVDRQELVAVEVFQGESDRASENDRVGEFEFVLEPVSCESPVHFHFAYDLDGLVRVSVSQPNSDNKKSVTIRLASGASSPIEANAQETQTDANASPLLRRSRELQAKLSGTSAKKLEDLLHRHAKADANGRGVLEDEMLDMLLDYGD